MPAIGDELLPDNAAVLSENVWLYSGRLRGLPVTKNHLHPLVAGDTTKVYRIPSSYGRATYLYNSVWMEFPHMDTDVVRAPVFDDVYDRYYWASPIPPPKYNTRERIEQGNHPWTLGINPPTTAPDLAVVGGSVRLESVRVATTAAGTLATDFITGKTIDGVVLKAGDRILIKDQVGSGSTQAPANGVRIVGAATPARATDMDTSNEFVKHHVKVLEGTAQAGTSWEVTNATPPNLGTDPILFEEVSEIPLTVTRSYVYTWVTEYGEESAPSLPVVETGIQDGSWNLTNLVVPEILDQGDSVLPNPNAVRWITKTRIYRTITSAAGVATFFLVDEVPCSTTSYNDTKTDDDVSLNEQLESFSWTPPPSDIQGLTVMWNGMVAGFRENELWVCEPYRPHAWPAKHVLTMEYPIVGLGVATQTLVVCTSGNPVTVNGSSPNSLTTAKIPKFEPCTSRGSILSSPSGVLFVSPNGLILCGQGGAVNITKDLLTRDRWKEFTGESKLRAAWLGEAYYAFGGFSPNVFEPTAWCDPSNDSNLPSPPNPPPMTTPWVSKVDTTGARSGVLIDPVDTRIAFNVLTSETPVFNVQNDAWSGEVFLIRDGLVNWLDITDPSQAYQPAFWRSKVIQTSDKKNLGAMKVYFHKPATLPELNPLRNTNVYQVLAPDQWGLCRVYANGELKLTRELRESGELWKLPSGFLAEFWQYEIETRLDILSFQVASSTKELVTV